MIQRARGTACARMMGGGMAPRPPIRSRPRGPLGFWGAVAIGVGGMVGGGIFAVLGLAVQLTGGGAPLAFLLAGLVALLTARSYARLSVAFPSQGGTVTFIDRAFGRGLLAGSLNVLLWLGYVVMLSLYAHAFGSYAASLAGSGGVARHAFASVAVLVLTGLNAAGSAAVGRAETVIVAVKVAILLVFVGLGMASVDGARLAPATWAGPGALLAGGMLIFLAYEGFELIANTAHDVRDPARTLPRAYFTAVGFVTLLYVAVAAVTVGNLPLAAIAQARDYALAEAARPFLGHAGFTLIGVAALLSTASAINATLYGAARFSYIIAKEGELPEALEHKVWGRPIEGLLITAGATLLVTNLVDLSGIAVMGSAGFLLIFAVVNAADARLAGRTGSRRWLAVLGAVACLGALAALLGETARTNPARLLALPVMVGLAVVVEAAYRAWSPGRR
jgi:amino acid transporter